MTTGATNREVIAIEDVSLVYRAKNSAVHALDRVSIVAAEGEFIALVGPSGCGKSTLLKLVSGLIPPSGGVIRVERAAGSRTDRLDRDRVPESAADGVALHVA